MIDFKNLYTICKFIRNNKNTHPMVSRSLGKIAIPSKFSYIQLNPDRDNDTFWFVKVLGEVGTQNKGYIEVDLIQLVDPIPLIPGFFDSTLQDHWVFLHLKSNVIDKPFFVPYGIKHSLLNSKAVVCIPYDQNFLNNLIN